MHVVPCGEARGEGLDSEMLQRKVEASPRAPIPRRGRIIPQRGRKRRPGLPKPGVEFLPKQQEMPRIPDGEEGHRPYQRVPAESFD